MTQVGKQSITIKTQHGKEGKVKTGKVTEPLK